MRSFVRRTAILLSHALLLLVSYTGLRAQAHQWLSMNGILSNGATETITSHDRIYFCGYIPASYSSSEGWRRLSGGWGVSNILVAPDGRLLSNGNAFSFDSIQPRPVHFRPGYDRNFAIDSSGVLYAVGSNGIAHSRDWYTGWTYVDTVWADIPELGTTKTGELVAMCKHGILISTDSGHSWKHSLDTAIDPRLTHSIDLSNPSVWFAEYNWPHHNHFSRNRGLTWIDDTTSPHYISKIKWRDRAEGYTDVDSGIYVTKDTGKTWRLIFQISPGTAIGLSADTIFAFRSGVLYYKSYSDSNWKSLHSLPSGNGSHVSSVYCNPSTGSLLVSTNDGGFDQGTATLSRSDDTGNWWKDVLSTTLRYPPVGTPTITGTSHGLFYYGHGGTLLRSTDDGVTWFRTMGWIGDTNIVSLTELPAGELYAVNGSAIYKSADGIRWGLTYNMPNVMTIGCDSSARLYAATSQSSILNPGSVFRSTNGGSQWQKLSVDLYSPHSIRSDSRYLYLADDNGVFRSSDYGDSWTCTNSGGDRQFTDALPLGDDSYAMLSLSSDLNDYHLTEFLHSPDSIVERPSAPVSCISSDTRTHIMFVGMVGGGLARSKTPIYYGTQSVSRSAVVPSLERGMCFHGRAIAVRFVIDNSENFEVSVWDLLGRKIIDLNFGPQTPGAQEFIIPTTSIPRGSYFLEFHIGPRYESLPVQVDP